MVFTHSHMTGTEGKYWTQQRIFSPNNYSTQLCTNLVSSVKFLEQFRHDISMTNGCHNYSLPDPTSSIPLLLNVLGHPTFLYTFCEIFPTYSNLSASNLTNLKATVEVLHNKMIILFCTVK